MYYICILMRILKIKSLPKSKTWVDRDTVMLHACFQILEDCVELEKVDEHVNYDAHKDFVDEVRFLYQWWQKRKIDEYISDIDDMEQMKEDEEMLIRLMKIRCQLWT